MLGEIQRQERVVKATELLLVSCWAARSFLGCSDLLGRGKAFCEVGLVAEERSCKHPVSLAAHPAGSAAAGHRCHTSGSTGREQSLGSQLRFFQSKNKIKVNNKIT